MDQDESRGSATRPSRSRGGDTRGARWTATFRASPTGSRPAAATRCTPRSSSDELERIGSKTASDPHRRPGGGGALRAEAEAEAAETIVARPTRGRAHCAASADDYAEKTREEADEYAAARRTSAGRAPRCRDAEAERDSRSAEAAARAGERRTPRSRGARASDARPASRIVQRRSQSQQAATTSSEHRRRDREGDRSDLEDRRDAVVEGLREALEPARPSAASQPRSPAELDRPTSRATTPAAEAERRRRIRDGPRARTAEEPPR